MTDLFMWLVFTTMVWAVLAGMAASQVVLYFQNRGEYRHWGAPG